MKLVGFKDTEARIGTNEYQQVYRLVKQKRNNMEVQPPLPPSGVVRTSKHPPLLSPISVSDSEVSSSGFGNDCSLALSSRSSLSTTNSGHSVSSGGREDEDVVIPDDFTENYYVWPLTYLDDSKEEETKGEGLLSLPSQPKPKSLQSLTTTTNFHNTTKAAHKE